MDSFVDKLKNTPKHHNPRVTPEFIDRLAEALFYVHDSLNSRPEFQEKFADAAKLAFGASFTKDSIVLDYLEKGTLPRADRIAAQLFVLEKQIDNWSDEKLAKAQTAEERDDAGQSKQFAHATHVLCDHIESEATHLAIPTAHR